MEGRWASLIRRVENLLRLRSFPVGLKLLEDARQLTDDKLVRRPAAKATLCQLLTLSRTFGWTVGATAEDFSQPICPSIIGLVEVPPQVRDGTFRSLVWCRTRANGKKFEEAIPRIPTGRYQAIALAPQVYELFEPDMVLIYANPAQIILIINALQFEEYERMKFYCVGESSCSDAIAQCYLTGKPSLTIPCFGERRYGHVQDDELIIAVLPRYMEKIERNLQELYTRGIQYPIPYAGVQVDLLSSIPLAYRKLFRGEYVGQSDLPRRRVKRW